jgi:hypothetical protein
MTLTLAVGCNKLYINWPTSDIGGRISNFQLVIARALHFSPQIARAYVNTYNDVIATSPVPHSLHCLRRSVPSCGQRARGIQCRRMFVEFLTHAADADGRMQSECCIYVVVFPFEILFAFDR